MEIMNILFRGFLSLLTLFLVTKLIGKKQVSELSLFDYVIGLSIGNFAAEITINNDVPLINGIVAVLQFGIIGYIVSIVTLKSIKIRRFMMGVPTIIVQEGKLIEESFKKTKYDINDFLEECRCNGYFDLNEIEYAIVEANGKISFMPKSEYKPATPKDMKIKVNKQDLLANVIIDSKIMTNNLENMGKEKEWLDKELKVKGYKDYSKILLATLDSKNKLTIYEKNKQLKVNEILE